MSDALLVRLARAMLPGAELRFATDIDDYAGWTLARILRSPDFVWPARGAEDWIHPWAGWPGRAMKRKRCARGVAPPI